jgi:hypothetical protein
MGTSRRANGKMTHGGKREERRGPYGACGKNRVIVCAACGEEELNMFHAAGTR